MELGIHSINKYSLKSYLDVVSTGKICLLDIDTQGFKQIMSSDRLEEKPHSIFITADSDKIEDRLRSRGILECFVRNGVR